MYIAYQGWVSEAVRCSSSEVRSTFVYDNMSTLLKGVHRERFRLVLLPYTDADFSLTGIRKWLCMYSSVLS